MHVKKLIKCRFAGLYLNYLVLFKNGKVRYIKISWRIFLKGKNGEPTDKIEEAQEAIPLEQIADPSKLQEVQEKVAGVCFQIPCQEETYILNVDSSDIAYGWIKEIQSYLQVIQISGKREPSSEVNTKLKQVEVTFPQQSKLHQWPISLILIISNPF